MLHPTLAKFRHHALALGAGLLAMAPGMARAAEPPCVSMPEVTALVAFSLPPVISAIASRCSATLPPESFLRTQGAGLAARYALTRTTAWPGAKAAFLRISAAAGPDMVNTLKGMPDPALQALVDSAVASKVADGLPLDRCAPLDRVLSLLSPLPPESTSEVVGTILALGGPIGRKLQVCVK